MGLCRRAYSCSCPSWTDMRKAFRIMIVAGATPPASRRCACRDPCAPRARGLTMPAPRVPRRAALGDVRPISVDRYAAIGRSRRPNARGTIARIGVTSVVNARSESAAGTTDRSPAGIPPVRRGRRGAPARKPARVDRTRDQRFDRIGGHCALLENVGGSKPMSTRARVHELV